MPGTSATRRPIALLPATLQNQIAAGEVVERPASVVKELAENSLDARATRVHVTVERGGQGLIRIEDDGAGIPPGELELALTRHATSKIAETRDLFAIVSFGFRGEALASVSSVSRLTLASRTGDREEGVALEVAGGRLGQPQPCAMDRGTRVEVRDLFFNLPARLKFLKSPATEARRCRDTLTRLSLANLGCGFSLTLDGTEAFRVPPRQTLSERLAHFWPPALCQGLIPFEHEGPAGRAHGLAGSPSLAQPRAERLLFWVNGRPVADRMLQSAVREAYSGRLLAREYPQMVLFLELDPAGVDVNVHPAKAEVRFRDESAVFSLVRRAVRAALDRAAPLAGGQVREVARAFGLPGGGEEGSWPETGAGTTAATGGQPALYGSGRLPGVGAPPEPGWALDAVFGRDSGWTTQDSGQGFGPDAGMDAGPDSATIPGGAGRLTPAGGGGALSSGPTADKFSTYREFLRAGREEDGAPSAGQEPEHDDPGDPSAFSEGAPAAGTRGQSTADFPSGMPGAPAPDGVSGVSARFSASRPLEVAPGLFYLGQTAGTYLVLSGPQGLVLVDQHAAHERVMFEAIRQGRMAGESRPLTLPLTLALHPAEEEGVRRFWPDWPRLGFDLALDPGRLCVRATPADLEPGEAVDALREILSGRTERLEEAWVSLACRRAVKAHTPLAPDEALALLSAWLACPDRDYCPHGRPTVVRLGEYDLERMFKRKR
jgi:DNA mismatch repair protein MutL